MSFFLKSSQVVLPSGIADCAIEIENGKIKSIVSTSAIPHGARVIDAGNNVVMPGLVDTHAHINEPGRTEWEGFETATKACAAGGITTVIDMPLNSIPATTTLDALRVKQREAKDKCFVDYGFWGGVVPGNASELSRMADAGVIGFKAFMCESGVDEFKFSKEADLREAMPILKKCGVPLLVHAEVEGPVPDGDVKDVKKYKTYLFSRPRDFENNAIKKIVTLVKETECSTHIVHLSSSDALSIISDARSMGLPLTAETCPHYLSLVSEEIPDGATYFKCAPPIRERENCEKLWDGIKKGLIEFIVSDHSPCTPALKHMEKGDFVKAWGGISSIQFSLPVVWTEMKKRGFELTDLVRLMCVNTAKFAGLFSSKGSIEVRKDADLLIFDSEGEFVLDKSMIKHRHNITPYEGRKLSGRILKTFLRGELIYDGGKFTTSPTGIQIRRNDLKQEKMTMSNAITSQAKTRVPFTDLIDLANEKVGGKVLECSDDFFASKDNLIKAAAPIFIADKYVDTGKWMDGWESRRKRGGGHDWCVVGLGIPGVIHGVNIDTSFFTGNYPEYCSIEGSTDDGKTYKEILKKTKLQGDTQNLIPLKCDERITHLKLHTYPDGGVARLRVHGEARADWKKLGSNSALVDLASAVNGATVIAASDVHYGSKDSVLYPGRAEFMGGGWETRRSRGPNEDWIIIKLAHEGVIEKIEVDTNHYKGNYPDSCSIVGCTASMDFLDCDFRDKQFDWNEILPRTKLEASKQHYFEKELKSAGKKITHLKMTIYPDGGVSRLRVWGKI